MVDGYYWFLDAESDDWEIVQIETQDDLLGQLAGLHRRDRYVWFFCRDGILLSLCELHGRFEGPIVKQADVQKLSAQIWRLRLQAQGDRYDALTVAAEALEMVEALDGPPESETAG